jgi:hypothetical protein
VLDESDFFAGMISMGMFVNAAFFLRFWRRSRDWLFLVFALALSLLALSYASTSLIDIPLEESSWVYLVRLTAYSLLLVAIIGKNFSKQDPDA